MSTVTQSRILSAEGLVDGRPAAIAFTSGDLLGSFQEATLFIEGGAYHLGPAELLSDGRVLAAGAALSFRPDATYDATESRGRGWIHHTNRWSVGDVSGTLTLPSGDEAEISWTGLLEWQRLQR